MGDRAALILRAGAGAGIAALMLFGPPPAERAPGADAATLAALHARCSLDMLRQTCRAMPSAANPARAEGRVFVAGVGAVPASVLEQWQAAGSTMCDVVRRHCAERWDGNACRSARALYLEPPRPES